MLEMARPGAASGLVRHGVSKFGAKPDERDRNAPMQTRSSWVESGKVNSENGDCSESVLNGELGYNGLAAEPEGQ